MDIQARVFATIVVQAARYYLFSILHIKKSQLSIHYFAALAVQPVVVAKNGKYSIMPGGETEIEIMMMTMMMITT